MARIAVPDFAINNPLYAGANVFLLSVEAESDELLEVFADPAAAGVLPNPQRLNAQGRWQQPIYVNEGYRLRIQGSGFDDHETGNRLFGLQRVTPGTGISILPVEPGIVRVQVANPFTVADKQKLDEISAFNLWAHVTRDVGAALQGADRIMLGDASDGTARRNGFATLDQLKTFIATIAAFDLYESVSDDIGTDIADTDVMVLADVSALGEPMKRVSITNLRSALAARYGAETVVADHTVTVGDYGKVFFVDTTASSRTISLSDLAAGDAGFRIWIVKTAAPNVVTIDPDGAALIEGATDFSLSRLNASVLIAWTGTAWSILEHRTPGYSGFDLHDEFGTPLQAIADDDLIAMSDESAPGDPNRRGTARQIKTYANTLELGTLADEATVNWDASLYPNAIVTLSADRIFAAPTNAVDNQFYLLTVKQDATGGRTITWNSVFDFTTVGGTPTLTTTADGADKLLFLFEGGSMKCLSVVQEV